MLVGWPTYVGKEAQKSYPLVATLSLFHHVLLSFRLDLEVSTLSKHHLSVSRLESMPELHLIHLRSQRGILC